MKTYIAFLRGINVGGKRILPMRAFVKLLEELGSRDVKTYIQSGNAVFRSCEADGAALSNRIRAAIKRNHGFEPAVHLLGLDELDRILASNPYPEAESEPKTLHICFLDTTPKNPDLKAMNSIKAANERFALNGRVIYLHAPDGIGRSKLAASAERLLGVSMTGRNWRTVSKVAAMASVYK